MGQPMRGALSKISIGGREFSLTVKGKKKVIQRKVIGHADSKMENLCLDF